MVKTINLDGISMDLIDRINEIAKRVESLGSTISTEEATKNAFIMPFIQALGYDVFNPSEVVPEFTADHGLKKGEKVDYAIIKDGVVSMLFECKKLGTYLKKEHGSQLYRYFSTVTEVRFGVLTNGQIYEFYSDLDSSNQMDQLPFFTFDILKFDKSEIDELKKFSKNAFELENILSTANDLKYTNAIIELFEAEYNDPSEEFVRYFAAQVYNGSLRKNVVDQFNGLVKKAYKQFINERINSRLQSALSHGETNDNSETDELVVESAVEDQNGVVTTDEELEGYNVIRAILRKHVAVDRIAMRDNKSYFAILLDDNNRKPLARLRFNTKQKYLGILANKDENRIAIETIDDIFNYEDELIETLKEYLTN